MAVTGKKVIRFTADGDIADLGLRKIKIIGVRLVTVAADSVAKVYAENSSGEVLYSLASLAKASDESSIPTTVESGKLYVSLSGAAAEVYVYVE